MKNTRFLRFFAVIAVASPWLVPGVYAQLGGANLTWNPPTEYTDGMPLTVVEHRIYRSTTSGGPYGQIGSVPAGISAYVDSQLFNGTYCYVVTALDPASLESVASNEACKTISVGGNTPRPKAPTNLQVQ